MLYNQLVTYSMSILAIPFDIISEIFKFVDSITLVISKRVCKKFKLIISDKRICGPEPLNYYQMMLTDNVFYFNGFKDIMHKSIDTEWEQYLIRTSLRQNFLDNRCQCPDHKKHFYLSYPKKKSEYILTFNFSYKTASEMFEHYYSKYYPESNIYQHIKTKNSYSEKCTASIFPILASITYLDDLVSIKRLDSKTKILSEEIHRNYILIYATIYGHLNIILYLYSLYPTDIVEAEQLHRTIESQMLIHAIENKRINVVNYILEKHADHIDKKYVEINIKLSEDIMNFIVKENIHKNFDFKDKLLFNIRMGDRSNAKTILDHYPGLTEELTDNDLTHVIANNNYKMFDMLVEQGASVQRFKDLYIKKKLRFYFFRISIVVILISIFIILIWIGVKYDISLKN